VIGIGLTVSVPSPHPSIYALCVSCLQQPFNGETAYNLAVALQRATAWEQGYSIALYSRQYFQTTNALVETALGYSAMYSGDGTTADQHFAAAVRLDSTAKEPHVGLGLLALARGQIDTAHNEFRAALALGHSMAASMCYALSGVDDAGSGDDGGAGDGGAGGAGAPGGGSGGDAPEPSIMDDPGFAATAGNLMVMGDDGAPLDYPIWDAGTAMSFGSSFQAFTQWWISYQAKVMASFKQRDQLVQDAIAALEGALGD
jgi:hypothetical protein